MEENFRIAVCQRDGLASAITQFPTQSLSPINWDFVARQKIPVKGGLVGGWTSTSSQILPEVIIVRDEDFGETLAWINSFFASLSPVSQWCRIIPQSRAKQIAVRPHTVSLGRMLGGWVGGILAECSVQSGGVRSLLDVPGSAAGSTATYAAGRATAIWAYNTDLGELARRHDALAKVLHESTRPVSASQLIPLWAVLSGSVDSLEINEKTVLEPLVSLLELIANAPSDSDPSSIGSMAAVHANHYYELADLLGCSKGPQVERVRALDRLGERLSTSPKSALNEALLGLGASLIDPGLAIAPELLRKFSRALPLAPIWQGVFAGAMVPMRIMTDQGGLGRLVSKTLLAPDDLEGRPSSDIAFEELIRWITPGRSLKADLRGMSTRTLSVELMLGVTCTFTYGPAYSSAPSMSAPRDTPNRVSVDRMRSERVSFSELEGAVAGLTKRVELLEARKSSEQLGFDLEEAELTKSRKSARISNSKTRSTP